MGKGQTFERDFCRQLTDWWTGGTAEDVVFWRTAGSGGRATSRAKTRRRTNAAHAGDIGALTPDAEVLTRVITFELKKGYHWEGSIHDLLDRNPNNARPLYADWFAQAEASRKHAGAKYWAVVHARTRRKPLITIPLELFEAIDMDGEPSVYAGIRPVVGPKVCIFPLAAFFAICLPETIRRLV